MKLEDEIQLILAGAKGPRDLPLERMAEYMREFARMLGEPERVLFSGVKEGSVCIAARARLGYGLGPAANRTVSIGRGEGSAESRRAYEKISEMAAADNRRARVQRRHAVLLHFPTGAHANKDRLRVRNRGHVTGQLSGLLEDTATNIRARLRPLDGGALIYCEASYAIGDKLGAHFRKVVRIFGPGWWERKADGTWVCKNIEAESFEPVENIEIRSLIDRLRGLAASHEEDTLEELWTESGTA
ncbi:MAG: hypothetical protein AAF160_04620 [Pseudomonadota bacterium]